MKCPKCGVEQPEGEECISCGIIFEKFYAARQRRRERRLNKSPSPVSNAPVEPGKPAGPVSILIHRFLLEPAATPWRPVQKYQVITLSLLFAYIVYSITRESYYQLYPSMKPMEYFIAKIFKQVDLVFHEGGHWIFAIFGSRTLTVLGGSLNQLLVPCVVAGAFWMRRDIAGFGFGLIWIGINLMEVGIYMADARKPILPLIGGMDPFDAHDWRNLFNWWDLWTMDTAIAKTTYYLGWYGMLFGLLWFVWTGMRNITDQAPPFEPM